MEAPLIRILCLEDDEEDFEIINDALLRSGLPFVSSRVGTKENLSKP